MKDITIKELYAGITYPTINHMCTGYFLFGSTDYFNSYFNNFYLSGLVSGLCITIPVHITDYFKTNTQLQLKKPMYHLIPYCHTGIASTCTRECIGSSVYFGGYHHLKSHDIHPFISGGISGMASWLCTYPIDVVKTRVTQYPHVLSYYDAFCKGNLYSGLGFCLLRGFLVNGTVFLMYDILKT